MEYRDDMTIRYLHTDSEYFTSAISDEEFLNDLFKGHIKEIDVKSINKTNEYLNDAFILYNSTNSDYLFKLERLKEIIMRSKISNYGIILFLIDLMICNYK